MFTSNKDVVSANWALKPRNGDLVSWRSPMPAAKMISSKRTSWEPAREKEISKWAGAGFDPRKLKHYLAPQFRFSENCNLRHFAQGCSDCGGSQVLLCAVHFSNAVVDNPVFDT